jgi:hypothetical protein
MTQSNSYSVKIKESAKSPPRRAIVFLRSAHPKDHSSEYPAGRTIAQQRRAWYGIAKKLGVIVTEEYIDHDPGLASDRDVIDAIRAEAGDADYLLVFSVLYLCEDYWEYRDLREHLLNYGRVEIIDVDGSGFRLG